MLVRSHAQISASASLAAVAHSQASRLAAMQLPTSRQIDRRLVAGSVLFGIGWGLSGYCPGPALASVLVGGLDVLVFVAALGGGLLAAKRLGL